METECSLPLEINDVYMFHISALNGYIELFITMFTAAPHLFLSSARSIQSSPSQPMSKKPFYCCTPTHS